jgi:CheY-like chemotaxis protein
MEMENEKNAETNSATDDNLTEEKNLSEDQYEITVGDIDSGDLEFDVVDDEGEVVDNEKNEEQLEEEITTSDSGDLDFDVVDDEKDEYEDDVEENLDYKNDANALDDLPPLEESDLLNLDIEEPLDNVDFGETAQQDDFFDKFTEDELSPLNFAGKQIVIFYTNKEQAELLKRYLSDRTGMEVECIGKKENLWRYLKIDSLDLIILETGTDGNTDAMKLMQQTKDQFPEVHFICLSGPVSLERRLQFINAGALDYLTRPLHLSTIAQSILVLFSRTDIYDIEEDFEDFESEPHDIPEEEPIVDSAEDIPDKKSGSSAKRVDDELDLADEIDLIDEDF